MSLFSGNSEKSPVTSHTSDSPSWPAMGQPVRASGEGNGRRPVQASGWGEPLAERVPASLARPVTPSPLPPSRVEMELAGSGVASRAAQSNGHGGRARPRRHRPRLILGIVMAALAALVAGATLVAYLTPDLFTGTPAVTGSGSGLPDASGMFIGPPYTPAQINQLRHLVDHMSYKQLASLYVAHMSLDEKLGQLIMVEYNDDHYSADLDNMITNLHAGGVIMYEFQMQTFAQTKHDIATMQQRARIPLLISTDEEGGPYVHRLSHIYGPRPSAWDIYQSGSVAYAAQEGHKMAHDLLALGINVDLAPDVDIMLVPGYDTVTRTFGTTAADVIKYAGPFMAAMQEDGLIACIKHYPGGLGDTTLDAHKTLPSDNRSASQIYSTELAPYKYFINASNKYMRPGIIMPTDVLMPAIDSQWPAELSYKFMTQILRQQFGYDGVVLTDALYMQGIAEHWNMPEAAVIALNAGNDMLLGPNGSDQTVAMIEGLKAALQDGRLSILRVNEAVTRIIALKMQYHLMPAVPPQS
jgi:beta-N-acetylhexosaminidase